MPTDRGQAGGRLLTLCREGPIAGGRLQTLLEPLARNSRGVLAREKVWNALVIPMQFRDSHPWNQGEQRRLRVSVILGFAKRIDLPIPFPLN